LGTRSRRVVRGVEGRGAWTISDGCIQALDRGREARGAGVEARGAGVGLRGAGVEARGAGVGLRGAGVEVRGAAVEARGAGEGLRGAGVALRGAAVEARGAGEGLRGGGVEVPLATTATSLSAMRRRRADSCSLALCSGPWLVELELRRVRKPGWALLMCSSSLTLAGNFLPH